jgi:alkylhydroperoxidase family enzyme
MAPEVVAESEAAAGVDNADAADFTPRERAAIHFAEKMAVDHHNIGDEDVAAMRRHFSDAEFLELAMMAGQYIGFGRVLAMLQLEVASCPI